MKEFIINQFHLAITFFALVIYVILCFMSKYIDNSKQDNLILKILYSKM